MTSTRLVLADPAAISDLTTFAGRALRLDGSGSVRIHTFPGGIACYVAPLYPTGLADPTPTVLAVRTVPGACKSDVTDADVDLDVTVALDAFVSALGETDASREVVMPPEASLVAWTAVTPPRTGWESIGSTTELMLHTVLDDGIAEVARGSGSTGGTPASGALAVQKLRGLVWGRPVEAWGGLPAGAAWALDGLGFTAPGGTVKLYRSGVWFRASAQFGDVLARSRPTF